MKLLRKSLCAIIASFAIAGCEKEQQHSVLPNVVTKQQYSDLPNADSKPQYSVLPDADSNPQYSVLPNADSNGRVTAFSVYDAQNKRPDSVTVKTTKLKDGKSVGESCAPFYQGKDIGIFHFLPIDEKGRIIPGVVDEIAFEIIEVSPQGKLPEPFRVQIKQELTKAYDNELYDYARMLYENGIAQNPPVRR